MALREDTGFDDVERELADAVAIANIPTLLMVLVQLTGERRWLEAPYRPSRAPGMGDNDSGGLPEAVQAEVRDAALEAILASPQFLFRLEPVPPTAVAGQPYRLLAAEQLALLDVAGGDTEAAVAGFRAILGDAEVGDGQGARVTALLAALGAPVEAAAPGAAPEAAPEAASE